MSETPQVQAPTDQTWLQLQLEALGRIGRNFGMLAKKFRGAWRPALRKWWLVKTWPVRLRVGVLLCMLNSHQDQEAPAVDKNGDFIPNMPGRYSQCQRPKCQRIRGRVTLLETDRVCEVPDLLAIAWKNCKACGGRGYGKKMLLGPGKEGNKTRAKVPCDCVQVQPVFLEHMDEPAAPVTTEVKATNWVGKPQERKARA